MNTMTRTFAASLLALAPHAGFAAHSAQPVGSPHCLYQRQLHRHPRGVLNA
jgi:hypothetical protein